MKENVHIIHKYENYLHRLKELFQSSNKTKIEYNKKGKLFYFSLIKFGGLDGGHAELF